MARAVSSRDESGAQQRLCQPITISVVYRLLLVHRRRRGPQKVGPLSRCYNSRLAERQIIIYPGSFDPPTNGHLDLVGRASKLFDDVIVAVLEHDSKDTLFDVAERLDMLAQGVREFSNVTVDSFDGLLVDFARRRKAKLILRGIRAVSDYEYELQMALMNRKLDPELETVFMLPAEAYSYLSSRLVKEVCRLGGDISDLVPPLVEERLEAKRPKLQQAKSPAPRL